MYAYVSFLIVILTYGMETAFFRFSQNAADKDRVYSTALISLIATSLIFVIGTTIFSHSIAELLRYPRHKEYVIWFALIIALDALCSIPFAKLRAENKAMRFASIKLIFIGINIGLNLLLIIIFPYILKHNIPVLTWFIKLFYTGKAGVAYVFIANLIASIVTLIALMPDMRNIKYVFDSKLWKTMIIYALPLLIAGFAGIINETMDRVLLKYLLPKSVAMSQLGIYGACYKISIIMTIFIQAFRYAADPFFFSYAKEKDSDQIYSQVMNYFVITVSAIFLFIMLYIDLVIYFVGPRFRVGAPVIPILLLANLFLGIFYNLSIWYKLTNQTKFGAYLAIFGAILTLVLNFYWIPRIGYMGSALATLICYFAMMLASYFLGKKYYFINYNIAKISLYLILAVVIYLISSLIPYSNLGLKLSINTIFFIFYALIVFYIEKPSLKLFKK